MLAAMRKAMLVLLTTTVLLTATGWLGPGAFHSASIARAEGDAKPTHWAKWTAQIDFQSNLVNARWTVFLGRYGSSGELIIENQKTVPLECKPVGNLVIQHDEAIFDGASYLDCTIPNFYDAVKQLLNGAPMPFDPKHFNGEFCKCTNPMPWVAVDAVITSDILNPILYQVDNNMQFFTAPGGGQASSNLLLAQGAALPQQLSWPIDLERGNQLWSGSGMPFFLVTTKGVAWWYEFLSPKFYDVAQGLSLDQYLHWANTEPAGIIFDHVTDFKMTNKETHFLVGYDNSTYFIGKLRKLAWDPPCVPSD